MYYVLSILKLSYRVLTEVVSLTLTSSLVYDISHSSNIKQSALLAVFRLLLYQAIIRIDLHISHGIPHRSEVVDQSQTRWPVLSPQAQRAGRDTYFSPQFRQADLRLIRVQNHATTSMVQHPRALPLDRHLFICFLLENPAGATAKASSRGPVRSLQQRSE